MYASVSSADKKTFLKTIYFETPDYIPMTFHINESCYDFYPKDALFELMENHFRILKSQSSSFLPMQKMPEKILRIQMTLAVYGKLQRMALWGQSIGIHWQIGKTTRIMNSQTRKKVRDLAQSIGMSFIKNVNRNEKQDK